jgi:hypothetical protein
MAGMELDDDAAAELDLDAAQAPDDVELRVRLLGCLVKRGQPRGDQLLWLVRHHPEIDLGGFSFLPREQETESDQFGAHLILCDVAKAAAAARQVRRGRHAAAEVLRDAPKYERTWQFGNSIHWANITLGHMALDEGDVHEAGQKLLAAGATRGSPQLNSFGPDRYLARRLLAADAREVVARYLRECCRFWQCREPLLSRWIAEIEAGVQTTLPEYDGEEADESG